MICAGVRLIPGTMPSYTAALVSHGPSSHWPLLHLLHQSAISNTIWVTQTKGKHKGSPSMKWKKILLHAVQIWELLQKKTHQTSSMYLKNSNTWEFCQTFLQLLLVIILCSSANGLPYLCQPVAQFSCVAAARLVFNKWQLTTTSATHYEGGKYPTQ
jgi:hypothetical protein